MKTIQTILITVYLVILCNTAFAQRGETESLRSSSFSEFYSKWRGQNKPAIDFTAYDIDGNQHRLSDFKGKTIILDWWNTRCHMCIRGFPGLDSIAAEYASQGVVVIAAGTPEPREDFDRFVRTRQHEWPNLIFIQDRSTGRRAGGVAFDDYAIFGLPAQIIINKDFVVVYASNFKSQIITALPLAGIIVDEEKLKNARVEAQILEDRMASQERERRERMERGENSEGR